MPKKTIKDPISQSSPNETDETLEILENEPKLKEELEEITEPIQAVKPKKKLTEKQIEQGRINLENGRKKKAEIDTHKREEAQRIALEEKKIKEEKLIKKAVAVRKKQLKRDELLNEISDDETPVQKERETEATVCKALTKVIKSLPPKEDKPIKPIIKFF